MLRLSIVALALLTTPTAAQTVLAPGSDALADPPATSTTYVVRMAQPQTRDIGSFVVTETLEDERLTMTSRILIPMGGVDQTDSTTVAWPTLAPIYRYQTEPGEVYELTFAGGRATGTATADGETRELDVAVADTDFGSGILRRIARSLPFETGYLATLDQIEDDGDRASVQFSVTGPEAFDHHGDERTVWIVTQTEAGNPTLTYRIDAETRAMLQMALSPQPGVWIHITAE